MHSLPSITVVIPAHNAAAFFEPAMRSIRAQEYANLEVSIVDDGSDDNLAELVPLEHGLRIHYVRQENKGPAAARNVAIRKSEADFIAFLDMDDLWTPGHLHRLSAVLQANPDAGIAQGEMRNFLCDPEGVPHWCSEQCLFINLGTCLYRRQVFETCGLIAEDMRFAEDYDLMLRCYEQRVPKVAIGELSLLYRRHANNVTNGKDLAGLGTAHVYKKRLDRIRAGLIDPAAPHVVVLSEYLGTPAKFFVGARAPLDPREWLAASGTPTDPKVSVVVPAYNAEAFLGQALQSILGQQYRPLEILVVDDGSTTEAGVQLAESFGPPVRVIRRQHVGHAAARNAGVAAADGEYLAFLDADDLWSHDKLRTQVEYLESHPEVDLVMGRIQNFHSPELTDQQKSELTSPLEPAEGYKQCAMLVRRSAFNRVGPLDDQLVAGDFAEWLARATDGGLNTAHIPQIQVYRRLHANNVGRTGRRAAQAGYLRAAKQIMDRRRRQSGDPTP